MVWDLRWMYIRRRGDVGGGSETIRFLRGTKEPSVQEPRRQSPPPLTITTHWRLLLRPHAGPLIDRLYIYDCMCVLWWIPVRNEGQSASVDKRIYEEPPPQKKPSPSRNLHIVHSSWSTVSSCTNCCANTPFPWLTWNTHLYINSTVFQSLSHRTHAGKKTPPVWDGMIIVIWHHTHQRQPLALINSFRGLFTRSQVKKASNQVKFKQSSVLSLENQ